MRMNGLLVYKFSCHSVQSAYPILKNLLETSNLPSSKFRLNMKVMTSKDELTQRQDPVLGPAGEECPAVSGPGPQGAPNEALDLRVE